MLNYSHPTYFPQLESDNPEAGKENIKFLVSLVEENGGKFTELAPCEYLFESPMQPDIYLDIKCDGRNAEFQYHDGTEETVVTLFYMGEVGYDEGLFWAHPDALNDVGIRTDSDTLGLNGQIDFLMRAYSLHQALRFAYVLAKEYEIDSKIYGGEKGEDI